jgi:hypothetical protein
MFDYSELYDIVTTKWKYMKPPQSPCRNDEDTHALASA